MADKSNTSTADAGAAAATAAATSGQPGNAPSGDAAKIAEGAAAGAAAAAAQLSVQSQEAPSIAEQAKKGDLPDPVELALKARGATGSGRRLDETIPGGLTVHPDGYYQNAAGEEVEADGTVVPNGKQPRIDLSGARVERI